MLRQVLLDLVLMAILQPAPANLSFKRKRSTNRAMTVVDLFVNSHVSNLAKEFCVALLVLSGMKIELLFGGEGTATLRAGDAALRSRARSRVRRWVGLFSTPPLLPECLYIFARRGVLPRKRFHDFLFLLQAPNAVSKFAPQWCLRSSHHTKSNISIFGRSKCSMV